jgi:hypothetical protein
VTWGQVHAGDTVRGADGRDYRVASTEPLGVWVGSGRTEILLELAGPDALLTRRVRRPADEAAPIVARADHSDTAAAYAALAGAGLAPDLIGETTVTSTTTMDPAAAARREAPMGKWGWYRLPDPGGSPTDALYPRVTTIAGTLDDEFGLTAWKLRMAVKGVALRPDLIARAASADTSVDKGTLDKIVESAMEKAEAGAAANFGSAMHKFAERLDAGESIASMGVPAQLVPDLEAYAAALRAHGLTVLPEYSERTVVNADDEYAGTWDKLVRDRTGALYLLDVKTGRDLSYGWLKVAIQEALYSRATHMCSRDYLVYDAVPTVDQMKGLVLHLPLGSAKCQIYGVPLDKGWAAAQTALEVRGLRTQARKWAWLLKPDEPADVIRLHVDRAETLEALLEVQGNAIARHLWTDELMVAALARYDLIRINGATRAELADLWAELHPAGRWTPELGAAAEARVAYLVHETGIK